MTLWNCRIDLVEDLVDVGGMDSFNIHEAKTHFSQILAKVQAGEEVIIAKAGEPIARIVPIRSARLRVPETEREDFDAPLPDDLLDKFEGRQIEGRP